MQTGCRGRRGRAAPREQSEDRSLAGTFVSLIRQQHAQRACLLERGAQHLWKETDQMADCARCKKLSYITVAIDNTLAAVRSFACTMPYPLQYPLAAGVSLASRICVQLWHSPKGWNTQFELNESAMRAGEMTCQHMYLVCTSTQHRA